MYRLFDITSFVTNNCFHSTNKCITCDINVLLRNAFHSFKSFARSEAGDEWGVAETLASKIDQIEKFSGLRSGLLAGQSFFGDEKGNFPLNSGLSES